MTKKTVYFDLVETPLGKIIAASLDDRLIAFDWVEGWHRVTTERRLKKQFGDDWVQKRSETVQSALDEFQKYLTGDAKEFKTKVYFCGTPFQENVWNYLCRIPYGKTVSYSDVAEAIGKPAAFRAVANAVGANPLSIFVPCHRVIASDGTIGGYGGGLDAKLKLLAIEKVPGFC